MDIAVIENDSRDSLKRDTVFRSDLLQGELPRCIFAADGVSLHLRKFRLPHAFTSPNNPISHRISRIVKMRAKQHVYGVTATLVGANLVPDEQARWDRSVGQFPCNTVSKMGRGVGSAKLAIGILVMGTYPRPASIWPTRLVNLSPKAFLGGRSCPPYLRYVGLPLLRGLGFLTSEDEIAPSLAGTTLMPVNKTKRLPLDVVVAFVGAAGRWRRLAATAFAKLGGVERELKRMLYTVHVSGLLVTTSQAPDCFSSRGDLSCLADIIPHCKPIKGDYDGGR